MEGIAHLASKELLSAVDAEGRPLPPSAIKAILNLLFACEYAELLSIAVVILVRNVVVPGSARRLKDNRADANTDRLILLLEQWTTDSKPSTYVQGHADALSSAEITLARNSIIREPVVAAEKLSLMR